MRVVRIFLQVVFGLLSGIMVLVLTTSPNPDYYTGFMLLGTFIFIILVLGPWWPTQERVRNLPVVLDRMTGIPNATPILVNAVCAVYAVYRAWETVTHPGRDLHSFEKPIFFLLGTTGVMAAWVLIGVGCIWYGYRFFRESQASRP
jgi:hypothetical protein